MKSHAVDYQIFGDDLQFVEIELDPQETVVAEAGAMMYMVDGISFEAKMGDGSNPRGGFLSALGSAAKRAITGESLFMTHFTNNGQGKKQVAFGAPYPGKIIAIDLDETNGELICQKDSFLCAALGTQISIAFNKSWAPAFLAARALSCSGWPATVSSSSTPGAPSLRNGCRTKS